MSGLWEFEKLADARREPADVEFLAIGEEFSAAAMGEGVEGYRGIIGAADFEAVAYATFGGRDAAKFVAGPVAFPFSEQTAGHPREFGFSGIVQGNNDNGFAEVQVDAGEGAPQSGQDQEEGNGDEPAFEGGLIGTETLNQSDGEQRWQEDIDGHCKEECDQASEASNEPPSREDKGVCIVRREIADGAGSGHFKNVALDKGDGGDIDDVGDWPRQG